MRRLTAILLLSVFLFSNTPVHELVKIGAFIEHFQEHRAIDANITLLEFLQIHYFSGNVQDEDYARDMQLPFKVLDFSVSGIVFTIPPTAPLVLTTAPISVKKQIAPCDQSLLPFSHLSDIWQPPKYC